MLWLLARYSVTETVAGNRQVDLLAQHMHTIAGVRGREGEGVLARGVGGGRVVLDSLLRREGHSNY
jgi:hypothetical protein